MLWCHLNDLISQNDNDGDNDNDDDNDDVITSMMMAMMMMWRHLNDPVSLFDLLGAMSRHSLIKPLEA